MRERLSKDFTREMYQNWKGFYEMFENELKEDKEVSESEALEEASS